MRWRLTLILIMFGYLVSLLIFQRGQLLKRQVVTERSKCADVVTQNSDFCWISARFKRAVVLVVDALRYDFIEPKLYDTDHYFHGQMSHMAQLLNTINGETSKMKLFHFISDAPTTIFQRVKALVTGNILTFVEADENFGVSEIMEDNWVDQFVTMGRNITFLGDDTWFDAFSEIHSTSSNCRVQVLPERFHRHFVLPSFDIKDLHTVDNLVIANIYDEIRRPEWNVLVAHVLGVDHCGHRYGVHHPEMRRKLWQMDELIYNLTLSIDDDTLLVVIGDHGMTNHGGDSRVKVKAALMAYSQRGFGDTAGWDGGEVEPIDIVPTLSILLGVPIPFSNLGRVIEPLVSRPHVSQSLKLNAAQVIRYAQRYAGFDATTVSALHVVTRRLESAPSDADAMLNRETIESVKRVMRQAFQANDMPIALIGLLSLIECVVFTLLVLQSLTTNTFDSISWSQLIFRSALLLLQLSLFFDAEREAPTSRRADLLTFNALTLFASLLYSLGVLFAQLCLRRTSGHWRQHAGHLAFGTILIAQPLTFASNSFVIGEPAVLRFLLALFLTATLASSLRDLRRAGWRSVTNSRRPTNAFTRLLHDNWQMCVSFATALCIVRLSALFVSCREEDADCNAEGETLLKWVVGASENEVIDEKIQERIRCLCAFTAVGALFTTNYYIGYRVTRNVSDSASLERAFTWPLCIGVALHWLSKLMEKNLAARGVAAIVARYAVVERISARAVYLAAILFVIVRLFATRRQGEGSASTLRQVSVIVLAMVLGDCLTIIFCALVLMFYSLEPWIADKGSAPYSIFSCLFGATAFYALGHQCAFTPIPWRAVFVGLPNNFPIKTVAASLVLVHMFAGNLFGIFMISLSSGETSQARTNNCRTNALLFLSFNAFRVLGSSVTCLFLWNNLMFFKIFAPKFVFEAVNLMVCSVAITLLHCVIVRR